MCHICLYRPSVGLKVLDPVIGHHSKTFKVQHEETTRMDLRSDTINIKDRRKALLGVKEYPFLGAV